jgi:hypothetical protein
MAGGAAAQGGQAGVAAARKAAYGLCQRSGERGVAAMAGG